MAPEITNTPEVAHGRRDPAGALRGLSAKLCFSIRLWCFFRFIFIVNLSLPKTSPSISDFVFFLKTQGTFKKRVEEKNRFKTHHSHIKPGGTQKTNIFRLQREGFEHYKNKNR